MSSLVEFVQLKYFFFKYRQKYCLYIHKKLLFSKSGLAFQQMVLILVTSLRSVNSSSAVGFAEWRTYRETEG